MCAFRGVWQPQNKIGLLPMDNPVFLKAKGLYNKGHSVRLKRIVFFVKLSSIFTPFELPNNKKSKDH